MALLNGLTVMAILVRFINYDIVIYSNFFFEPCKQIFTSSSSVICHLKTQKNNSRTSLTSGSDVVNIYELNMDYVDPEENW